MAGSILRRLGTGLLFAIVTVCLAITIVPHFLDAVYYRGPVTGHFDGQRFFNPDGDPFAAPPADGKPRQSLITRLLTGRASGGAWPKRVPVRRIAPPTRVASDEMVATWIGHATFLVQSGGLNILTDPIFSDRAGPWGIGPRRVAVPGIALDRLPRIDLILISHNHYDHMDLASLKTIWDRDRPVIVTSLGNDALLRAAGIPGRHDVTDCGRCPGVQTADWGGDPVLVWARQGEDESRQPGIAAVHVTRNHHWGSRWFADRNRALWSSFVVRFPSGGNLFFAGDTGAGDLRWADEAAALGPIRLALIPIGAFRFEPGQMASGSHIGPVDAVEIARRLGASRAIGMHWGTFKLSSEGYDTPPRLLAAAMRCTGQGGRFDTAQIGQPQRIAFYSPPRARKPMSRSALLACLDTPAVRAMR